MMIEEWKLIPGYEKFYEISTFGRIKSLSRKVDNFRWGRGRKTLKEKIMKGVIVHGYVCISLRKDNKYKRFLVHRLVAQSFIKNPLNKKEVNHIDCDKTNNNVSNLEWCTPKENSTHASAVLKTHSGVNSHFAKLTENQVIEIRNKYATGKYTQRKLAKEYGVLHTMISRIVRRENWKHLSF